MAEGLFSIRGNERCNEQHGTDEPLGTAMVSQVLEGVSFSSENGYNQTGTMKNNGALNIILNTKTASFTIPNGYHTGYGVIKCVLQSKNVIPSNEDQLIKPDEGNVLSAVTVKAIEGDCEVSNVLAGKTFASSNGTGLIGTMIDVGSFTQEITTNNSSVSIPKGYHDGTGKVTAKIPWKTTTVELSTEEYLIHSSDALYNNITVKPVTGTATESYVLEGYTFCSSNGINLTGTMKNYTGVTMESTSASYVTNYIDNEETGDLIYIQIPKSGLYRTNSRLIADVSGGNVATLKLCSNMCLKTLATSRYASTIAAHGEYTLYDGRSKNYAYLRLKVVIPDDVVFMVVLTNYDENKSIIGQASTYTLDKSGRDNDIFNLDFPVVPSTISACYCSVKLIVNKHIEISEEDMQTNITTEADVKVIYAYISSSTF